METESRSKCGGVPHRLQLSVRGRVMFGANSELVLGCLGDSSKSKSRRTNRVVRSRRVSTSGRVAPTWLLCVPLRRFPYCPPVKVCTSHKSNGAYVSCLKNGILGNLPALSVPAGELTDLEGSQV